jgi:hypothetical protein
MRISFDDAYLMVTGEDGILCIFDIRDKEGGRALLQPSRVGGKDASQYVSSSGFSEEILVTKSDLEEKHLAMTELKNKVDELTLHNEYQLRLKDMTFNEHLKDITDKFTREIEQEKANFEEMREHKNDIEMEYEERLKQLEEKHQQEMLDVEASYQEKIMKEVEKYQEVFQQRESQRKKWQDEQQRLVETHERYETNVCRSCGIGGRES